MQPWRVVASRGADVRDFQTSRQDQGGYSQGPWYRCRAASEVQPLTYVLKDWKNKRISVSDCSVRPRSGRENIAEICTPPPVTNLRLANLRLGNP